MRRISAAIFRCLSSRLSLRGQEGSLLIEVMVGAVLVVTVSAAVLDGLKGAQNTGLKNRARTVSSSLSQQDQERLRAKPVEQLSNLKETRKVTVGTVEYTIVSDADWVNDSSGVVSCTNNSTQASYLRILSTVTSEVNKDSPVVQTSLVSPPRGTFGADDGTAAVQVVDRNKNPLQGVRVDLEGPQSYSDVTNDLGCVVFGYIPQGPWLARVSSLGLVGTDGKQPYETAIGVVGGSTVLKQVELDRPASITTTFDTQLSSGVVVAKPWSSVRVSNARLPSPGSLQFDANPSPALTITADNLFPFLDGYGVYAGSCEDNNPAAYDDNYYTKAPGNLAFVSPSPAGTAAAVARLPAINMQVRNSSGTVQVGARIFVTAADPPDCTDAFPMQLSNASGALPEPAFPFGTYTVCADNNATTSSARRRRTLTVVNTNPAGVGVPTPIAFNYPSSSTSLCAPNS